MLVKTSAVRFIDLPRSRAILVEEK